MPQERSQGRVLTADEERSLVAGIKRAERGSRGEVRVQLEGS